MLPLLQPRSRQHQHPHPIGRQADRDGAVRLTDNDAALARLSAVQRHYLTDPYITHLVPRAHLQPPRPPLINIGTYVRSEALDDLVDQWLALAEEEGKPCQIVSFGAGSDTRFWRIATGQRHDWLRSYIELDFAENTSKKAMAIRKSKDLSALLGNSEDVKLGNGGMSLHAPKYHLLPIDLRLSPNDGLAPLLTTPSLASSGSEPILSPSFSCLMLFECVLVYMSPAASDALIQWFVDYFSTKPAAAHGGAGVLGAIVYEMFGLGDAFGKVMLKNLQARNVSLPGVDPYPTLASLPERFLRHGFTTSKALTLRDIRREHISHSEMERISQLEMLDEIEELELVLEHYAITWGSKFPPDASGLKAKWETWGLKAKDQEE